MKQAVGFALDMAQQGGKSPDAKPFKGQGSASVLEVVENYDGDTYRAVYTVRFEEAVYVLHCFQKKSKSGTATPKQHMDKVHSRLKLAEEAHKQWLEKKQAETVIEHGSGNVFADLGFEDAEEMLAKAKLVQAISKTMAERNMTQTQLADVLGIHQTKVSKLLRGITEGFSSDRLLGILTGLDQDIEIIIRPRPQSEQRKAHVSVVLMKTM